LLEYKALVPAQSDHFDGQRFFNPTGPALQPLTAAPRMLLTPRVKWPRYVPEVPRQPPPRDTARPVVTFVGHGTFLIQTAAGKILTDPVYSTHASPLNRLGPRRVRPAAIAFDFLPPISIPAVCSPYQFRLDAGTWQEWIQERVPMSTGRDCIADLGGCISTFKTAAFHTP